MLYDLLNFGVDLDLNVFHLLKDLGVAFLEGLHFMAFVKSIDDTLSANRLAATSEAEVTHHFVGMCLAGVLGQRWYWCLPIFFLSRNWE